ncbi:WD repeat-containing protein 11 [Sarcoptes scabiei]|uniref:WD repeat-containing protein 11 n=1 Tax=Sarcoptes scabiei TaxID=52283 RepID=A0A834R6L9_SARSC|nr:WD repeat-containing protein 11 [Sarcoptes scabiei]
MIDKNESSRIELDEDPLLDYKYSLTPLTIPGPLHPQNFGAIDWSINGTIAYGCQNLVIIVDTKPSLVFRQTLHRHKHFVCMLKWSPLSNHLCLCSIDSVGTIIIWDVLESSPLTVILATNENRSIQYVHWIYLENFRRDSLDRSAKSIHCWDLELENNAHLNDCDSINKNQNLCSAIDLFLLVFYPFKNSLIVYDADLGEPLVEFQLDYYVTLIQFNPFFQFNRNCDSTISNLLFAFKTSTSNSDNVYLALARLDEHYLKSISSPSSPLFSKSSSKQVISSSSLSLSSKEPLKLQLSFIPYSIQRDKSTSNLNLIKRLNLNQLSKCLISINQQYELSSSSSINSLDSTLASTAFEHHLLQIEFNRSVRNQIFLVFPREIYLIDLTIEAIITIIPIERNLSRLIRIYSCSLLNAFYAIHENGSVSFRLYQKKIIQENLTFPTIENVVASERSEQQHGQRNSEQKNFLNLSYVNICHSESIRLTKQSKIYGHSLSAFDETKLLFLLSNGKLIIKSLFCRKTIAKKRGFKKSSLIDKNFIVPCLNDLITPQEYKIGAFLVNDEIDDPQKAMDSIFYKLIVTHSLNGLNSIPNVIRQSPPLSLQNLNHHKPLLAVADAFGNIQIWLLNNGTSILYREFCAHSYPVAGIEWASQTSLITFSYPSVNSPNHHLAKNRLSALQNFTGLGLNYGKVTNELMHIEIETGKMTPFRCNQIPDSSPIKTLRVSYLRQYLIILFKRDDPFEIWDVKTLTQLRIMSKSIGLVTAIEWNPIKTRTHSSRNQSTSEQTSDSENSVKSLMNHSTFIKENFVVTSKELYHFSIEGNIIRELTRIPLDVEGGYLTVTSIAWKSDQVLFGDASGTLNLWDLKRKISRTEATYRSSIKKIRFGPGRGNMKCLVLYSDCGVDIWDISEFRLCSQLKYPRDINFKIYDVDWASSDLSIFASSDGFILISDDRLKTYSSPLKIERLIKKDFLFDNISDEKFKNLLRNLNVNYLRSSHRKQIFRKLIFSIPMKKSSKHSSNEFDDEEPSKSSNEENEAIAEPIIDLKQYIQNQIILAKLFSNRNDYDFWLLMSSVLLGQELDPRLDLFLDNVRFRHLLLEKLMILESNRRTYFHTEQIYRICLSLKKFQPAVQVLLESESFLMNENTQTKENKIDFYSKNPSIFYVDSLKACLIAALQSTISNKTIRLNATKEKNDSDDTIHDATGQFSSTNNFGEDIRIEDIDDKIEDSSMAFVNETKVAPIVKLVATNLIANGHINEGVELLTIISKTSDACRYLQSSDRWLDSIWLSKSSLDGNECTEIMRRWCEYLISSKRNFDKQIALKIFLSLKQFSRVLRASNQIYELKCFQLAILFIGGRLIDLEAQMDCLESIFDKLLWYFFNITDRNSLKEKFNAIDLNDECDDSSRTYSKHQMKLLKDCYKLFFLNQQHSIDDNRL